MLLSLFVFTCMGTLIIVGCKLNLRLYNAGALGVSRARDSRDSNTVAVESPSQETTAEDQFYMYFDQTGDKNSRFARIARIGLLLVGLLLVAVGIAVISMISVAL